MNRHTVGLVRWLCLAVTVFWAGPAMARQGAAPPPPQVRAVLNSSELVAGQQHVVAVVVDIPAGFHAHSSKPVDEIYIAFAIQKATASAGVRLLTPVYPEGENREYPALGKLNVYEGRVVVYLPVVVDVGVAAGTGVTISGRVMSQLCNDGFCFQPREVKFELKAVVGTSTGAALPAADAALFSAFDWASFGKSLPAATKPAVAGKEDVKILGFSLTNGGYPVAFLGAVLVGMIFNVMPCVLPVLPLKAVGFMEAAARSRARSVLLGVMFSAGLISIFAVLGLAIFAGGQQWGFLFQKWWFVYGMSAILVVMAASQWGLFTVRVPLGLYSYEPKHDTLSGNFMFGGLTALLSTPCTAYVFPALLLWAATQPAVVGVLLLISVGVGMAAPYFVMSCFPQLARKVPRTGPWSEIVKQMMGFLILATAVYFAGTKLLRGFQFMWPVAGIAVIAGGFLVYRTAKLMPRLRPVGIAVGLGLVLSLGSVAAAAALNRKTVEWTPYSAAALATGRAEKRVVLVDFTANWCANCHYVEATVFSNAEVRKALLADNVLLLKVDITDPEAPGSELLKKLNPAGGIPLTAIYFPDEPEPVQIGSIYTSATLLKTLKH